MARKRRAGIEDGAVIATVNDKFGEPRKVVQRGSRIRIANTDPTIGIAMNRAIAVHMGRAIREARTARGWTLEELAIRAGMINGWPKNRMYEIENGTRAQGIRLGTLYAIAAALDVEATSFFPPVATILGESEVKRVNAKLVVLLNSRGQVVEKAS